MATGRIGTNAVLTTRWSKAPAGGTTSLSGLDDNSVSLVYSVGYEQVYRNGTLLSRTNDYTATNGTTITLVDATIAGDIIEVFANATVPLTDTYSQTVADGKFINNTLVDAKADLITATAADTPARLAVGSNGDTLVADSGELTGLRWDAGTYTAWTPGTIQNFTLGNGTVSGRYRKFGKTVHFMLNITLGSTSSITGNLVFQNPVSANTANNGIIMGPIYYVDSGVQQYTGCASQSGTNFVTCFVNNASGTYTTFSNVNATVPFTFGNGDAIIVNGIYEAA